MNEISIFLKTSAVLKETPRRSGVTPWLVATTSTLSLAILIFFTLFPMAKGAGVETEAGAGSRTNTVAWSGVGKVIAEQLVQVNAKVAGEVIRVGAEIGAEVKAGDLLVELEPTQYQLGTERSQAKVALAKARLSRAKRLANENARDPEGLEIAEAELTLAEIELRWSQNDLANTKIIAPIDGVILRKQAEVGMIADPKSPTGVHLYEMADLRHLAVLAEVAGVNRVARRQPCLIHYPGGRAAPGQAGETWKGEVENIGAVIDPNTGTFPVRVKIEGVGTSKVNPGAFVEVDFLAQD